MVVSQGIQPLTDEEQEKLLASRLDGGMSFSFRQFANQFLVTSRFQLGQGIGLMTLSKEIANLPLHGREQVLLRGQRHLSAIRGEAISGRREDGGFVRHQESVPRLNAPRLNALTTADG